MAWPLWDALPEALIYNMTVLMSYPLSGWAAYLLCRELWGGHVGPPADGLPIDVLDFSPRTFADATPSGVNALDTALPALRRLHRKKREGDRRHRCRRDAGAGISGIGLSLR